MLHCVMLSAYRRVLGTFCSSLMMNQFTAAWWPVLQNDTVSGAVCCG